MILLGSIKLGESTRVTTHTKSLADGTKLDILKLIELVGQRTPTNINLNELDAPKKKNPATGFSKKRYSNADVNYPLIAGPGNFLLDGRHRYFKLLDNGINQAKVHLVSTQDMDKVKIK